MEDLFRKRAKGNLEFDMVSFFVVYRQLLGETILLVGSISLGLVAYVVADIRQRRAFLDTRQSFAMRLTIENQAREQVHIHPRQ